MIDLCEDNNIYTGSGATLEELTTCQLLLTKSYNDYFLGISYLVLFSILAFFTVKILLVPFIDALFIGRWRGRL